MPDSAINQNLSPPPAMGHYWNQYNYGTSATPTTQHVLRQGGTGGTEGAKEDEGLKDKIANRRVHGIMGFPPHFNRLADPSGDAFLDNIMGQLPVVNIIPGIPSYSNTDFVEEHQKLLAQVIYGNSKPDDESTTADNDILGQYYNNYIRDSNSPINKKNDSEGLAAWFASMWSSLIGGDTQAMSNGERDQRYYGFAPNYSLYVKYVNIMLNALGTRMLGYENFTYNLADFAEKKAFNSGLSMYVDKATSVSESASTEYGSSMMSGMAKGVSEKVREFKFMFGWEDANVAGKNDDGKTARLSEENTKKQLGDSIKGLLDGKSKGTIDEFVRSAVGGKNLLFPDIWKDSSFSKDYQLSFKLVSPYGDKESIFRNVYVPFVCLLALSLPRQDSYLDYYSPFIVRIDSPGWFTCDMGYVSDMSFKKGGDGGAFNVQGLPLEMEVNMTVKDLYPAISMTKDYATFEQSLGISGLIDNMVGLGVMDFKEFNSITAWAGFKLGSLESAMTFNRDDSRFTENAQNMLRSAYNRVTGGTR